MTATKTASNKVPFVDLIAPHKELEEELVAVCRTVFRTAGFIGGPMVEGFEAEFARFCDVKHCIGVASGTDAVRFALMAAGVNPGDVVLTTPNTFIATTEAISQAGATPEFVDVDAESGNLDPRELRKHLETNCDRDPATGRAISRRTGRPITAIVPVHLWGQMADMDAILEVAEEYGAIVVEDACQAHGAEYFSNREQAWRKAGSMGVAAGFSFYPGKNLGACGEAGAVTTNDDAIAQKIRMIRDHGQIRKYYHAMEGYNGRLDALQAGLLRVKLEHLSEWNEQRRHAAQRYGELLSACPGIGLLREMPWAHSVYHLYVILTPERERMRQHFAEVGVDTGIHYPIPLHLQDAYRQLGYRKGDFPVAERLSEEILSLPMFPGLTPAQQDRVAREMAAFLCAPAL
jgi:dTDP-4-amino-4,6-dideoxygalactose transaminase